MIKMVESIIVKRFIGETCCNHFVWMLPPHAALVQFTAEQCPHVTRQPSVLDMSNFLTGFFIFFIFFLNPSLRIGKRGALGSN